MENWRRVKPIWIFETILPIVVISLLIIGAAILLVGRNPAFYGLEVEDVNFLGIILFAFLGVINLLLFLVIIFWWLAFRYKLTDKGIEIKYRPLISLHLLVRYGQVAEVERRENWLYNRFGTVQVKVHSLVPPERLSTYFGRADRPGSLDAALSRQLGFTWSMLHLSISGLSEEDATQLIGTIDRQRAVANPVDLIAPERTLDQDTKKREALYYNIFLIFSVVVMSAIASIIFRYLLSYS